MRAYVITSSDSGYRGERRDLSGPAAKEILEQSGYQVEGYALLPDERALLADKMREICDGELADLIVTTGGTGFSKRDCTPEATLEVAERLAPGISEAIRLHSLKLTPRAMLSRALRESERIPSSSIFREVPRQWRNASDIFCPAWLTDWRF